MIISRGGLLRLLNRRSADQYLHQDAAGGVLLHMETSDSLTSSSGGAAAAPSPSRHRGALLGAKASSSLTAVDALHLLAMYLSAIMHDYDHRCVIGT